MSTPWGAPQTSTGFKTGEYAGALVLVTVVAYESSVPTTYGDKDAVMCNVTVAYHPQDNSKNGEAFPNARIFNAAIVGSLRAAVGQTVGGRITMGRGQGGNTKYTLDEVTDENSVAYLNHYWQQHCEGFNVDPATGASLTPRIPRAAAPEAPAAVTPPPAPRSAYAENTPAAPGPVPRIYGDDQPPAPPSF